jgi:hypothetical protein
MFVSQTAQILARFDDLCGPSRLDFNDGVAPLIGRLHPTSVPLAAFTVTCQNLQNCLRLSFARYYTFPVRKTPRPTCRIAWVGTSAGAGFRRAQVLRNELSGMWPDTTKSQFLRRGLGSPVGISYTTGLVCSGFAVPQVLLQGDGSSFNSA